MYVCMCVMHVGVYVYVRMVVMYVCALSMYDMWCMICYLRMYGKCLCVHVYYVCYVV